jgi:hypothetical protein
MKKFTFHTRTDIFEDGLMFVRRSMEDSGVAEYKIINAYKSLYPSERNGYSLPSENDYGDKEWCFTVEHE